MIRPNSQIQNADVTYNQKFPVRHRFTELLLLLHYHNKFNHHGMELLANEVKRDYWVINLKFESIGIYVTGAKINEQSLHLGQMGQLPRLECFVRPFTYIRPSIILAHLKLLYIGRRYLHFASPFW